MSDTIKNMTEEEARKYLIKLDEEREDFLKEKKDMEEEIEEETNRLVHSVNRLEDMRVRFRNADPRIQGYISNVESRIQAIFQKNEEIRQELSDTARKKYREWDEQEESCRSHIRKLQYEE